MNMENCVETNNAGNRGLNNGDTAPGTIHRNSGFLIPAGILIGLGVGILVGLAGVGFLIGLGSGLLGSGLLPLVGKPLGNEGTKLGSTDVTTVLIGAFLIFLGVCFVYAPAAIWPYAFAGFLLLIGTWFLVRGFYLTT